MIALRGENGCPWDRKQTPRSMSRYLVEEMYELTEAIEAGTSEDVREELGDVLFHILFIAEIYREKGRFDIDDVAQCISEKMIRRHPHVFGDRADSPATVADVKNRWQEIKAKEKKNLEQASILDSIPQKTPPLMRAYRVSARAAGAGFDWDDVWGVLRKVEEEIVELKQELEQGNRDKAALELGDIFFTLVNVARFAGVHPDSALTDAIHKFERRFRHMEEAMARDGKALVSEPQSEKETYWESAKKVCK